METDELGSIEVEVRGDVAVVSLLGEHDIVTCPDVRRELEACLKNGNGLVVSLMRTEFLDSGIVKVLFDADQELRDRGNQLVLHVATASIVARVLSVSGLSHRLACTGSLDEAMKLAASTPERAEWTSR
jgi:anti-anti-sigma factor